MKLLLTLDFPPERGGIQRYLAEKAAHAFGAEDLILVGAARRPDAKIKGLPCAVSWHANALSRLNKKWSIINLFFLLVTKVHELPDDAEIECGNVYAALAPWLLKHLHPVRYSVYTYGGELLPLRRRSLGALVMKRVLREADTLFVLGSFGEQLLRQAGIERPVVVDPPRIDFPNEALPSRPVAARGREPLRLLAVGRLVPHKGHAVLLAAAAALPPGVAWRLVLAGSGPEERRLCRLIDKLKIAEFVTIKSGLDDEQLGREYRTADLFVLPSLETRSGIEGFGIVLLEAMAHGVPVVASRVGGVPEVLDEGTCGMLVKPGDPLALKEGILHCAKTPEARKRYAENALRRVRERYVW